VKKEVVQKEQVAKTEVANVAQSVVSQELVSDLPAGYLPEEVLKNATRVKISTEMGDMIAVLFDETAQHRDNFVKLANEGFYNDLIFHRVIKNFMIQGGDPKSKGAAPTARLGSGGPGYTVPQEINPKFIHMKGALSAARQGDQVNPLKNSSGSQFYVVQGKKIPEAQLTGGRRSPNRPEYAPQDIKAYGELGGTAFLDGEYTVFGQVIEGLDVIDKIAAVQTKRPGDRPLEDIKMQVSVVK